MENFDDTNLNLSAANLPQGTPFEAPEGYFKSLPDLILSRIKLSDISSIENNQNQNPFTVSEDYFNTLPKQILDRIAFQEFEKTISNDFFEKQKETILNTLSIQEKSNRNLPFDVPEKYFETMAEDIALQTQSKKPTFSFQFNLRNWYYAAAAILILSFGILYISKNRTVGIPEASNFNTDSLSTSEIINVLGRSEISEDVLFTLIDSKQLPNQIIIEDKDLENIIDELDESDLNIEM